MVLPLKPITSPSPSQQSPKVQPLLGLDRGGGIARGCGSPSWGTLPTLQKLKVEASGGVLGKVKYKVGYSAETLFSPSPDLQR